MKNRLWKYWRISKDAVESRTKAKSVAPHGFAYHTSRGGQYVFRKRLPRHIVAEREPLSAEAREIREEHAVAEKVEGAEE